MSTLPSLLPVQTQTLCGQLFHGVQMLGVCECMHGDMKVLL